MTNTYDTSDIPLGSTAVKVLYNNASNLDDAVNGVATTWADRFGVTRKSWAGIEADFAQFLISSGYEFIGDYVTNSPLTITRPNQVFSRSGEYYRAGPSLVLPYTTVANWTIDGPKFVSIGDAALRTELASPSGASLVGLQAAATGATLRNVRSKLNETISVRDFGAVGDGIADDSPAFNLAVAYANARTTAGTTILVPDGQYKLSSAITPITAWEVFFVGESSTGACLILPSGVAAFTFSGASGILVGGGFRSLKLKYSTAPAQSSIVFLFSNCSRLVFDDFLIENIACMGYCGPTAATAASALSFTNIVGYVANIGASFFLLVNGAGLWLGNVRIYVTGVVAPIHPASMTTAPNTNVITASGGFWDTIICIGGSFERFDTCIAVNALNGQVYQNFFFSSTIFDYTSNNVFLLGSSVGGVVATMRCENCWYVSWSNAAIAIVGGGYNDNHYFSGTVPIAGKEAVFYAIATAFCNRFQLQIGSVNRISTPSNAAMSFATGSSGFIVNDCAGNDDNTGVGFPFRASFGVSIGANCDRYQFSNNRFTGILFGWLVQANTTQSQNRRIHNNNGSDYATAATFALNGSGVPTYNTTPFVMDVEINGGVVTGISRDGVGLTGKTSGTVRLDPGHSITVSYTSTPAVFALIAA